MKRKLLLLSFLISFIALSPRAFAQAKHYDFKVEGIYYRVVDESKKTVIVTSEQKPTQANQWQAYAGTKPSGVIQIKSFVNRPSSGSYRVVGIDDNAFKYCGKLESVSLPSGLSSIGKYAFLNCNKLKSVVLPKDIKKISASTFQYCQKLESITFPNGLEEIEGFAFLGCSALKSLVFPETIKSIGKSAFKGCSSLTEVKCLTDEPVSLQEEPFVDVDKSKVTLYVPKSSLTKYKQAAVWKEFTNMKGFEKPYYDFKIDDIYYKIAKGNGGRLVFATSEQDPSKNNGRAYSSDEKKPKGKIKLPRTISYDGSDLTIIAVAKQAFWDCQGITSVILPSSAFIIQQEAFAYNKNLQTVVLPKGVKIISFRAFNGCSSLSSIKLPEGFESIGNEAFIKCSKLSSVEIPKTVKTIGSGAFEECTALKELKCFLAEPLAINANVFHKLDKSKVTLYVPKNSLTKYKQAAVWKEFGEIKAIEQGSAVEELDRGEMRLYPNPAVHSIELNEGGLVRIYSLSGKLVLELANYEAGTRLDISSLSSGTYLIKLNNKVQRFIKQ